MSSINKKLKYLREKYPMTKSELARRVSVSPAYITMLENGKKDNPSYELLLKISKALDCSITDLIGYEFTPDGVDFLDSVVCDNEEIKNFCTILESLGYEFRGNGSIYTIFNDKKELILSCTLEELIGYSSKITNSLKDFLEITIKHLL